jgi:hypothetical protein
VRELLSSYLEIGEVADAPAQAAFERRMQREVAKLLATEGYFRRSVVLRQHGDELLLEVDPGPRSLIGSVHIEIVGDLDRSGGEALSAAWKLPAASPSGKPTGTRPSNRCWPSCWRSTTRLRACRTAVPRSIPKRTGSTCGRRRKRAALPLRRAADQRPASATLRSWSSASIAASSPANPTVRIGCWPCRRLAEYTLLLVGQRHPRTR